MLTIHLGAIKNKQMKKRTNKKHKQKILMRYKGPHVIVHAN